MSNDPTGKNGLERDISKLRQQWQSWRDGIKPHWERFRAAGWKEKSHTLTNVVVESLRGWPYLWGHVVVVSMAVMILALFTWVML